ncbi:putative cyanobacterial aminoacyl-tRNA synthetase, CAAD domain, protein CURVATURE THYLAKOID 1 [Heracleum sosnowskyi]|uniref:Cyanobacterial aminoacyl-tRNA synthetase, CAAD domain, protein CURVATURE THYLAKOID 1 n=1 Tax=Heracleum sosnowskyi TaxID=360622 RepID=A0AAD8I047_9APIA|nr:putative cyanobacterial aminoacyl-tRNA synthetase, CAAD domain, protein CURVATURE THYLAKOID 1 [Heracleum sosnowskyi]
MSMATAISMATTAVFSPLSPTTTSHHSCALPNLPPRFSTSPSSVFKLSSSVCRRHARFQIKAASEETSSDGGEILTDLKEKWDAVENKSTVLLYGGGALVGVWLSATLVGAINSIPLLPKIMELVGLGYTGWFVYRYLLFKSSRKELATDIESLKKKIAGTD